MDELTTKIVLNEVEKGANKLKNKIEQYKEFINCNYELKEKMKEEFYKKKIQEAKDKKGIPQFKWDELPKEVEEIIMNFKYQIEYSRENSYTQTGYISEVIEEHKITGKSVSEYLFKEYKNENDEGIKRIFKPTNNLALFIWIMLNNKSFVEAKYHHRFSQDDHRLNNELMRITKNKPLSLEELIVFRNKQRKEQSEKRKAKNKEKAEKNDKELKELSKFKIGDLVYTYDIYCSWRTALIITGETKTQYRVEKVEWDYDRYRSNTGYESYICFGLSTDKSTWTKTKHRNIGKKSNIEYL